MRKQRIVGVLLALLVVACEQPVPRTDNATGFYDVSAYLKTQKAYLQQTQPKLLKTVQTGNQPPDTGYF